jgi:hypothetical protein
VQLDHQARVDLQGQVQREWLDPLGRQDHLVLLVLGLRVLLAHQVLRDPLGRQVRVQQVQQDPLDPLDQQVVED